MPTAHHHGLFLFRQTGNLALRVVYRAFGPDAGLRVVVISVLAMLSGKSPHEPVRIRQL